MSDSTRRTFLLVAGAGAAAAGVASIAAPAAAATASASASASAKQADRSTEAGPAPDAPPLVAYVQDAQSGAVALMVGEQEVIVHDRELVGRLTRAAEGK
ncbi:MAG TPA: hypothetical protein VGH11_12835 [Jatrophihabitans sp.]|jgi:hypothetical protein